MNGWMAGWMEEEAGWVTRGTDSDEHTNHGKISTYFLLGARGRRGKG
jgi:hypothetical protein